MEVEQSTSQGETPDSIAGFVHGEEAMGISRRNMLKATAGSAVAAYAAPFIARAGAADWSKLKGQTIVINWPSHPHFDIAKKLVPEFTAATGIKVELDEMQYLRMKDAQVLQMSK